jgi:hypothetical protein
MKSQTIPPRVEELSSLQQLGISLLGQSHLGKLELNFGLLCDIKAVTSGPGDLCMDKMSFLKRLPCASHGV